MPKRVRLFDDLRREVLKKGTQKSLSFAQVETLDKFALRESESCGEVLEKVHP